MPKQGRGDRQLRKNVLDVCVTTFWKLASACILLFVNEMSACVDCLRSSTGFILAEKVLYLVWKKVKFCHSKSNPDVCDTDTVLVNMRHQ